MNTVSPLDKDELHDGDNRSGCTTCWDISCEGCATPDKDEVERVARAIAADQLKRRYGPGWDRLTRYGKAHLKRDATAAIAAMPAVDRLRRLTDALRELHTVVRGECPSLLDEDSGGDAKLAIEIEELLADSAALSLSPEPVGEA